MISDNDKMWILQIVERLARRPTKFGPAPNKDILLLSLISIFEENHGQDNKFFFDKGLETVFSEVWNTHIQWRRCEKTFIEHPFVCLQNDKIWHLVVKKGKEEVFRSYPRATRERILECIDYGYFDENFYRIVQSEESRHYLKYVLSKRLEEIHSQMEMSEQMDEVNPFISYLNSLQNTDANNSGATAESQVANPMFHEIFVPHPLAERLCNVLLADEGQNIILTGHAGDGKSVLAHEVVRRLREGSSVPPGAKFLRRMEIERGGLRIVVVKDVSEWTDSEKDSLIDELVNADIRHKRYLLVSNTGRLLSFFCDRCNRANVSSSRTDVEDRLLTAFDANEETQFAFGSVRFSVWNLARQDNVDRGMRMLAQMIKSDRWNECSNCRHAANCPLYGNRNILLRHLGIASKRIEWLYRRAYAYGGRLTMRQLGAHFSYIITGGRSCADMGRIIESRGRIRKDRFLFANLFWGDDGEVDDPRAVQQLRAIALMREQDFNTCYSPAQEHEFWGNDGHFLSRTDESFSDVESQFRKTVSVREDSDLRREIALREARRRRNYRRMVFFLGTPGANERSKTAFRKFQSAFLNSPMLLDVLSWKADESHFQPQRLMTPLFRVLQEEFCGIRPQEGTPGTGTLYITLNRQSHGLRQSVQLVMARCDFQRCFTVALNAGSSGILTLKGKNELSGIDMDLPIPFLDYIDDRSRGILGHGLQRAYQNRIEVLKANVLRILHDSASRDPDTLALLQLKADGTFSIPQIRVAGVGPRRRLEVFQ